MNMRTVALFTFLIILLGCNALEDTDLNPVYFVECEIDGELHRAQTNDEAFMQLSLVNPNSYTVTGQDIPKDFHIDLYLFRDLGEGKIPVNTMAGNLLTSIGLFEGGKSYSASVMGGEGCVNVASLTENSCEGTFEGVVVEIRDEVEKKVITNGVFMVKTK